MGNDKFEFITEIQVWFNIRKTNEYNLLHEQSGGKIMSQARFPKSRHSD